MKILQIVPTLFTGGAEVMLCNLAIEEKIAGHEVKVVSFYEPSGFLYEKLLKNKIEVLTLEKKVGFDFSAIWRLRKIIAAMKPDVIHTHLHILPYAWLSSGKIPVVHTLHSIASKEQSGFGKVICGFLYKYSKKCRPVAISEQVAQSFMDEFHMRNRLPVVCNGVPMESIPRKQGYELGSCVHIFHVGRLVKLKNHRMMIDVAERLSRERANIVFHFFGSGEEQEALLQYAAEKNVDACVRFEGLNGEIQKILYQADLFILPSEYEGLPMSLIEAMAAGVPCVASNVGGIRDIITEGKDGLLIEPNAEALYNAIEKLLDDGVMRTEIGQNGIIRAQDFSSKTMMNGYLKVYMKD